MIGRAVLLGGRLAVTNPLDESSQRLTQSAGENGVKPPYSKTLREICECWKDGQPNKIGVLRTWQPQPRGSVLECVRLDAAFACP